VSDNARPRGACIGFGKSRPKHGYSIPNRCWRRSASNGPASPDGRPPVFMDCGSPVWGRSVRRVEGQQLGGLEAGRTAGTFLCLVVASLPIRLGPLPLTWTWPRSGGAFCLDPRVGASVECGAGQLGVSAAVPGLITHTYLAHMIQARICPYCRHPMKLSHIISKTAFPLFLFHCRPCNHTTTSSRS
jgi:hypothetical protein